MVKFSNQRVGNHLILQNLSNNSCFVTIFDV
jgi:hypothetical protein